MSETNVEIEKRARRETIVDSRLDGHDRRLAEINGQLVRGARATELVAERLQTLTSSVVDLRTEIHTKDAVTEALRERTEAGLRSQVSKREFWIGVMIVVCAIISIAVNSGLI